MIRPRSRISDFLFWICLFAGAAVGVWSAVSLYGWAAAFMGIGSGGCLGAVVYFLGAMIWSLFRRIFGK
ncbi:MAG TPA: hypothetical protein VGB45_11800 [Abditibacterium sp.]|jgi:hypothetical protein